MNRLFRSLLLSFVTLLTLHSSLFTSVTPAHALNESSIGIDNSFMCAISYELGGVNLSEEEANQDPCLAGMSSEAMTNQVSFISGRTPPADANGIVYSPGLIGAQGNFVAMLYQQQPSSREYIADILDNIGIPQVSSAYAQGTGYSAMSPFLEFWKSFRNLAYSLYIIMFVVVGVMIMLRTKINAQTVITVQAALPNLVITLLLITFSYAIVGFMIDLMYFLIYALVYLMSAADIISTPTKAISRLMGYSAWSVVFEGRNSIISAASLAISEVVSGLGSGAIEGLGTLISMATPAYLIVAIYLAISMLKLMFVLIKSYVMIIVQTITAPIQLLMNAMPGSEAFSNWLKKTASYLIPFPVAAGMFIMAAVFIGDPTESTIAGNVWLGDANPFGINQNHDFYSGYYSSPTGDSQGNVWMPPFTLTGGVDITQPDIMIILGFFIFTMTPSVVRMAQEWLQVKESPYAAEAFQGFAGIASAPTKGIISMGQSRWSEHQQRKMFGEIGKNIQAPQADTN